MKIGFGTTVLEKGLSRGHMDGIGVYAKNLWKEFEKTDQNGSLNMEAVTFGKNNYSEEANHLLGPTIYLPPSYPIQSARSIITGKPFLKIEALEKEIDLFFAPDHHIPKLSHIPVIATIMDAYPLIYPKLVSRRLRSFKNFAFKRASHWADHIVTISEYSRRDISKYFDIPDEKITAIPLGVSKTFLDRVPEVKKEAVCKKFGIKKDFFIFVGTIQPRKNISRLIKAYESLPSTVKEKHHLLIIGHYGWGEDSLWQKLTMAKDYETIRHLQDIDDQDLYALLQSALAMVYPSLYEGFGLPVLEGFASQIPVITSSTTSIPEVAADAASYVDPLDSNDITTKMLRIAQNRTLREEMVQRGVQRVKHYTWEKSAQEHIKLFKKLL